MLTTLDEITREEERILSGGVGPGFDPMGSVQRGGRGEGGGGSQTIVII